MMTEHTPGPWEWDEQWGGVTGPSGKRIVTTGLALTTGNHPVGEPEANARLIAAAPELLSHLAGLCDIWESFHYFGHVGVAAKVAAARLTISKAKGTSP